MVLQLLAAPLRRLLLPRAPRVIRPLATETTPTPPTPSTSTPPTRKTNKEKRASRIIGLRPTYRVAVNPAHGLYGFFRKTTKDDGTSFHDSLPIAGDARLQTGRSWTAAELRRKSFVDLHTLWYVLLRERNLCATQMEEGRRMGIWPNSVGGKECMINARKCRKSMARIKYVLNERRLLYEGAVQIAAERKAAVPSSPPPTLEEKKERLRERLVELMKQDRMLERERRTMRREKRVRMVEKKGKRPKVDLKRIAAIRARRAEASQAS